MHVKEGLYALEAKLNLGIGTKVTNYDGGFVLVTNADGYPPDIELATGAVMSGLWCGGVKVPAEDFGRFVDMPTGSTVKNCTFWGYADCIHPKPDVTITRNRFVNCGWGVYSHDIYVSSGIMETTKIIENIHLGGEGYKIHLYHEPEGITVHANFMAASAVSDLAVQEGHDTVTNNILWGPVAASYWNAHECQFNRNIFGVDRAAFADVTSEEGQSNPADGNVFCNGQTPFGTNAQVWDADDIAANLGHTKGEIDAAIASLVTAFTTLAPADLYTFHAGVDADFAVIETVIDAWKDQI